MFENKEFLLNSNFWILLEKNVKIWQHWVSARLHLAGLNNFVPLARVWLSNLSQAPALPEDM